MTRKTTIPAPPAADDQEAVLRLLANPATFGGVEVKRIDTHAASAFLAGDRALKIKRAVRLPYLDYSTLAKRQAACAAEIEVNQPFAPQLYRGVVAVTREADGRLALGGRGAPVEWAVEMRRFDETRTLDKLADAGQIDAALADRLARAVAAAHARAPAVQAGPWLAALAKYLDQNDAAFRAAPNLFDAAAAERLGRLSRAALTKVSPLLVARGERGLVRRGHGDLHLGNVALIDGDPVAFDAIEFDPLIASGDVLYDLAFLIMDLIERGLTAAANVVLNRYLTATRRPEDLDALAALPLFLSLRAAIRAMVTAERAERAAECDRAPIRRAARTYFDLACRLIEPPPPRLVAVGGLSGTGKSILARALAPDLSPAPGAVVLRSDVERKARFGLREDERLPKEAYALEVSAAVYTALAEKARRIVAAGHSAIVDAVYARPHERTATAAAGAPFRGLFLTAGFPTRLTRVTHRAADASDADAAVARVQEDYDLGEFGAGWTRIDASGTPEETLARARAALGHAR
jgi:aminoglycoside phosphotransferase family enzyme/predicted kinase